MDYTQRLEEKTVGKMIALYCRKLHAPGENRLCEQCQGLFDYARKRIARCPYGRQKPVCARCKVHCYQQQKREGIRRVMRYAGPRMIYHSPLLTLRYLWRKLFLPAPKPDNNSRE